MSATVTPQSDIPISVVMPVFNAAKYIRVAIDSVLAQTFEDFEYIIVDDGSADRSLDIIRSYSDPRIRLICQENGGVARALNAGLNVARGKYVARFDADDICMKSRFEKQYRFLEANPDHVGVGSFVDMIDDEGNFLFKRVHRVDWEAIEACLPRTPITHPAAMYRRDVALDCGNYHEDLVTAQDTLLFNMMARRGRLANIPEALICYRMTPTSVSMRDDKESAMVHRIIDRVIESDGVLTAEDRDVLQTLHGRKRNKRATYYLRVGGILLSRGNQRWDAARHLILALRHNPAAVNAWIKLALVPVPHPVLGSIRRLRDLARRKR